MPGKVILTNLRIGKTSLNTTRQARFRRDGRSIHRIIARARMGLSAPPIAVQLVVVCPFRVHGRRVFFWQFKVLIGQVSVSQFPRVSHRINAARSVSKALRALDPPRRPSLG